MLLLLLLLQLLARFIQRANLYLGPDYTVRIDQLSEMKSLMPLEIRGDGKGAITSRTNMRCKKLRQ